MTFQVAPGTHSVRVVFENTKLRTAAERISLAALAIIGVSVLTRVTMAKKDIKLSVAIAVFNEEKNLEKCLASVRRLADEIVVVDGGSSDATVSIARKFTSHIIETDNPVMFHINKQKALEACSGTLDSATRCGREGHSGIKQ